MRRRCWIVFVVVLAAVTTVKAQSGSALLDALTGPNCRAACYLGIEPGVTSPDEVEAILNAAHLSFDYGPFYPPISDEEPRVFRYRIALEENNAALFPLLEDFGLVLIIIEAGEINMISIVSLENVAIDDVLDAFGYPRRIMDDVGSYAVLYNHERLVFQIDEVSESIAAINLLSPSLLDRSYANNPSVQELAPCSAPPEICDIPTVTPTPVPTRTPRPTFALPIRTPRVPSTPTTQP